VAIAGNAVENTTALLLGGRGRSISRSRWSRTRSPRSPFFCFPALFLVSLLLSHSLTFVLPPVYISALALGAVAIWQITGDGEAREYDGAALVTLFVILGTVAFFE
jgi:Ca2+/H+ antiporter